MKTLSIYSILALAGVFLMSMGIKSEMEKDEKRFMKRAADARMMDWAEGSLAAERATRADIKAYGQRMVTEQDKLMNEIKALATKKNVILPQALSEKKADGLEDLKEETGKDFDKLFIKMIIKDHKRDIKDFKKALDSDDPDIREFANRNLPLLEDHLAKAQALKK